MKKEKSGDFGNPGTKINLISCVDLTNPMPLDFCFSSLLEPIAYILSLLPAVPPHSFALLASSIIILFAA